MQIIPDALKGKKCVTTQGRKPGPWFLREGPRKEMVLVKI